MDGAVFLYTDCDSIMMQKKHQEKQLRLKRRWLLGLSTSWSEDEPTGRREFLNDGLIPESMLREDDIFYETLKAHVEEAYRLHDARQGSEVVHDHEQFFSTSNVREALNAKLDALTNKALYLVTTKITGGSVEFEKTRKKMQEIIRSFLAKGFERGRCDLGKKEIVRQLHQVLNDPRNFRESGVTNFFPTVRSHGNAVGKLLGELNNLSYEALIGLRRKLKGVISVPRLSSRTSDRPRSYLINQVKKACNKMLSELHDEDRLQEPLAKAMTVAGLSLKLTPGYQFFSAGDLYQFPPDTRDLQNKLVKAIWWLKKVATVHKLKSLQLLLDPEADIPTRSLRHALEKLLTEYLFECGDMDNIPKPLLQALAVVNKSSRSVSHKFFPKEAVEEEVECILTVGAQMKQIVQLSIPDVEFEEGFTDAYMEELEDTDDDQFYGDGDDQCGQGGYRYGRLNQEPTNSQDHSSHSYNSDHEESVAEYSPSDSKSSPCATNENSAFHSISRSGDRGLTNVQDSSPFATSLFSELRNSNVSSNMNKTKSQVKIERNEDDKKSVLDQSTSRSCFTVEDTKLNLKEHDKKRNQNQYLDIQEVCDQTSLVAYNLIGHLLEKFAQEKGVQLEQDDRLYLRGESGLQEDNQETVISSKEGSTKSTVVEVVKELVPPLPESALDKLKKVMEVC